MIIVFLLEYFSVCTYVCMCVCMYERQRELEWQPGTLSLIRGIVVSTGNLEETSDLIRFTDGVTNQRFYQLCSSLCFKKMKW